MDAQQRSTGSMTADLACPDCHGELESGPDAASCIDCGSTYPVALGSSTSSGRRVTGPPRPRTTERSWSRRSTGRRPISRRGCGSSTRDSVTTPVPASGLIS